MLNFNSGKGQVVADTIENFMTLDLTGVGLISKIYGALQQVQPGPACMSAAELIVERVRSHGGPVVIATGFPEGAGVPETDGPVGAALIARALFLGLGIETVILTDDDWVGNACSSIGNGRRDRGCRRGLLNKEVRQEKGPAANQNITNSGSKIDASSSLSMMVATVPIMAPIMAAAGLMEIALITPPVGLKAGQPAARRSLRRIAVWLSLRATSGPHVTPVGLSPGRASPNRPQGSSAARPSRVFRPPCRVDTPLAALAGDRPWSQFLPAMPAPLPGCHPRCTRKSIAGPLARSPAIPDQARRFRSISSRISAMTSAWAIVGRSSSSASRTLARNQAS